VQNGLNLENITWSFTSTLSGNWHPLTWLSLMVDCQLFGMNSGWHHLINLLLHILNSILLFMILSKMTNKLWQSGFVAALFALHPLHAESVAWISERKDLLSTLFLLLTMWSYVWYVGRPKFTRYLPVLLFLALGLLTKPMLVTLPFVFLLLDYWPLRRMRIDQLNDTDCANKSLVIGRVLFEKIPLFILAAISSVITFLVQKHTGAVSSFEALPLGSRVSNALVSYMDYIGMMIWPSKLAVLYPHPVSLPWVKVAGAGLLLIIISLIVIKFRRTLAYLPVGWFWYIGTLVPVIGLVQVGIQAKADRYTYVPLIGLFIIITWGVSDLIKQWRYKKIALSITAIAVLLVLMRISLLQVRHWENSRTIFEHTLSVTTRNYLAHNNLGLALEEQGKIDEAFEQYLESLDVYPHFMDAINNMANLLQKNDRTKEAIKYYQEALKIFPGYLEMQNNLGLALQKEGRIDEAIKHHQEAIKIDPNYVNAYNDIGVACRKQGLIDEAIKNYRKALSLKPDHVDAHYNLGNALIGKGNIKEAIDHFEEATRISPYYINAHINLGSAFLMQRKIDEAIKHYRNALSINKDDVNALYNMGNALFIKGNVKAAIEHFQKALKIKPDFIQAEKYLNKALQRQ
jgi:tetratricopeptide (TPR) repeat protein